MTDVGDFNNNTSTEHPKYIMRVACDYQRTENTAAFA